jgi:putative PIN family toxin of toxin-antitoxin system
MRIVLDTNVLISGLMLPQSVPGRIVGAWRGASFKLIVSEVILDEVSRLLRYPKIAKRLRHIGMSEDEVEQLLALMRFQAELVDIAQTQVSVPTDPDDAPILATLIAANADWLVSGDADLLALREHYPIVTPQEFWQRCG